MSIVRGGDGHTYTIRIDDKVLFSGLILPPPNYFSIDAQLLLSCRSSSTTIIGSLPPPDKG